MTDVVDLGVSGGADLEQMLLTGYAIMMEIEHRPCLLLFDIQLLLQCAGRSKGKKSKLGDRGM